MNQCEDVQQERDEIEHYLRTLRKKVDHQIKNPFQLAFANFTFDQLATWKNNVMQLDATSKLYAQRVDFLHCGTMHILGTVLNQDIVPTQPKVQNKKEIIYDNHPHQANLEDPHKLNGEVVKVQSNILLWREVTKKRDALHQLMMNELQFDSQLRLAFFASEVGVESTSNARDEELGVYLKLLDFRHLKLNALSIYAQIEQQVSDANVFMLNFSGKAKERCQQLKIQQFFDLTFQEFQMSPLPLAAEIVHDLQPIPLVEYNQKASESEDGQQQSEYSFQFENWNKVEKMKIDKNKKPRKTRKKDGDQQQKIEDMIEFKGINPLRCEVLQKEEEGTGEKYLATRDYLLLKFIKYTPMFARNKKQRRGKERCKSKGKGSVSFSQLQPAYPYESAPQELPTISEEPLQTQNDISLRTSMDNPMKQHFKQAALPIKQMKKKIKQRTSLNQLAFKQIKTIFSKEQPLDIFISILHVAAQEQIMISI